MASLLWTILIILLVLWAIGFFIANLGDIIHVLLVIALIVLIYNFVTGRRTTY